MMLFSSGPLIQEEPQWGGCKGRFQIQKSYKSVRFPKGTLHFCKIGERKNGKFCQRRQFQIQRLNLKSSLQIISRAIHFENVRNAHFLVTFFSKPAQRVMI
jgi:hypothetical protein